MAITPVLIVGRVASIPPGGPQFPVLTYDYKWGAEYTQNNMVAYVSINRLWISNDFTSHSHRKSRKAVYGPLQSVASGIFFWLAWVGQLAKTSWTINAMILGSTLIHGMSSFHDHHLPSVWLPPSCNSLKIWWER